MSLVCLCLRQRVVGNLGHDVGKHNFVSVPDVSRRTLVARHVSVPEAVFLGGGSAGLYISAVFNRRATERGLGGDFGST